MNLYLRTQNTYRENYPNTTIVIRNDIKKLTGTYLMEQAKINVSELDILDGQSSLFNV